MRAENLASDPVVLTASVYRKLFRLITAEIKIYEQYIELLIQQRKTVTVFQTAKLQKLNERRQVLAEQMETFHEKRKALLESLLPEDERKLSILVDEYANTSQRKEISPYVEKLKELVLKVRFETTEFQGVQTFALNIVNGSLSILMRATKNVSKQYGQSGKIQESYLPRNSRNEGVLKQA